MLDAEITSDPCRNVNKTVADLQGAGRVASRGQIRMAVPEPLTPPLSRNENELFRELKRNETEQSSLPISTRLCRLQSK